MSRGKLKYYYPLKRLNHAGLSDSGKKDTK